MNIHVYMYVCACVCVWVYICMCAYIYIERDKIRWCLLCLFPVFVVSFTQPSFSFSHAYNSFELHLLICKVVAFLYGVFHYQPHSVFMCNASVLFPRWPPRPPALCIGSRSGTRCLNAYSAQPSDDHCSHRIQSSPKTLTPHLSLNIMARWGSFQHENKWLCSMSVMAS